MIVGYFGFQRSGKTALALATANNIARIDNMPIYTNLSSDKYIQIEKLTDIPKDNNSKILVWDEIHFGLDSRAIKDNIQFTKFLSTVGKQKILLLYTCMTPDLVDKRVRKNTSYYFIIKSDQKNIYYSVIDSFRNKVSDIKTVEKSKEFFNSLNYDTNQIIPNVLEANVDEFIKR